LRPKGAETAVPAYLPETMADVLPMFPSFPVRFLAEAHLPVDEREAYPTALKGMAVARLF